MSLSFRKFSTGRWQAAVIECINALRPEAVAIPGVVMEPRELQTKLNNLLIEHRDLDSAIDALIAGGSSDQVQVARLKKRKLRLRDEIAMINDQLVPDIIA